MRGLFDAPDWWRWRARRPGDRGGAGGQPLRYVGSPGTAGAEEQIKREISANSLAEHVFVTGG